MNMIESIVITGFMTENAKSVHCEPNDNDTLRFFHSHNRI
jgi:hypothetical protein